MRSLVSKIEANAAARLALPPGRSPAQELARYQNFLKVESHRLKLLHRSGTGGLELCRARAALVDVLLCHLWTAAKSTLSAQAQKEFPPLASVALGGYGRGELSPHSDIDFTLLHEGQVVAGRTALPHLSKIIDGVLLPLFDLGFKVGHSVRTVADCVQVANSDMKSKTALIEARLIIGDGRLFERLQKALLSKCVQGHEDEYIAARVQDQAARRERFGNSPTMQEPNLKGGCGGLRDYQNLYWMAFFKYRTRTLEEMQQRELIGAGERRQLEQAYDFLLRVRNELHYHVTRPTDVLAKSLQPAVATRLGYTERSPSQRLEGFMRDVYHHLRNIHLITRTLEERLALSPSPRRLTALRRLIRSPFKPSGEQPHDGFKISDHQIHFASRRVFREQPRRLMRVFLHAQQRGLRLHPDLAQLIRQELALVDRRFRCDPHVSQTFREILNQRGNVAGPLRAMHEVDLLGKYLPEFGRLTCLVQHEFYHQYAADEHTLQCLHQLDRVWEASQPPYQGYAAMFQAVERPFVLYLALLLHDAAKPLRTRDHSAAGGDLALRVGKRLGLDAPTGQALRLLVEQHLTMATVSQRRDLDDPAVIRHFAAVVQSPENLRMLTLHTLADTLATSDQLWNGFKDLLLLRLHQRTARVLTGAREFLRVEEQQRDELAREVDALLPRGLNRDEVTAHFAALPPRYFLIHDAREIVADLALGHQFLQLQVAADDRGLEPVVAWHNEPDRGYTRAKVCTWDRAGLFSKLAGSFSAAGINILGAQVFSRSDGIVFDTFDVTDGRTGHLVHREEREQFERILGQALAGEGVDFPSLLARAKTLPPLYRGVEDERIPTRIHFDNQASDTRTVIEVETEDRLGMLYVISQVFAELDLDISLARISTDKGAAIDSFYIAEADGRKVTCPERQRAVEARLRTALADLA